MSDFYTSVQQAISAASAANYTVDQNVKEMAQLIQKRLRAAGSLDWKTAKAFTALKRELRDWDMRRGTWKE
jgi:hypothetical protein